MEPIVIPPEDIGIVIAALKNYRSNLAAICQNPSACMPAKVYCSNLYGRTDRIVGNLNKFSVPADSQFDLRNIC